MDLKSIIFAVGIIVMVELHEARGQFATIIDVPPNTVGDDANIGSNTQVNVFDGGLTGGRLTLGGYGEDTEQVQLNVFGGHVNVVDAWTGSDLTISGGSIKAANLLGGEATMAGGSVQSWSLFVNSRLTVTGGYASYIETGGLTARPDPKSSELLITGGEVAALDATGDVTIEGGTTRSFVFRGGGGVRITGGTVGDFFDVGGLNSDGTAAVAGPGILTMLGGSVGDHLTIREGRTLSYAGGTIGGSLQALDGSHVSIVGSEFRLNELSIENPGDGRPIVLSDRNVTLNGRLLDGREFHFDLNDELGLGDYFSPTATVSITFVPEPPTLLLVVIPLLLAWTRRHRQASERQTYDWLVVGQIVPSNPAHAVRGPKHVVSEGLTPILDADPVDLIDRGECLAGPGRHSDEHLPLASNDGVFNRVVRFNLIGPQSRMVIRELPEPAKGCIGVGLY